MRRHPRRAAVDPTSPRAWATDDRSGFIGNHENLRWQYEWAGNQLVNLRILIFDDEYDRPQRQLGTIIIPPDPPPIIQARVEQYNIDEVPVSVRATVGKTSIRIVNHGPTQSERIISVAGNLNP